MLSLTHCGVHAPSLQAVALRMGHLLAADGAQASTAHACAAILISLAHLRATVSPAQCAALAVASQRHGHALPESLPAELLWAFATLGWRPDHGWLAWATHALHRAHSMRGERLVQAIWALSVLSSEQLDQPGRASSRGDAREREGAGRAAPVYSLPLDSGSIVGVGATHMPQLLQRLQPHLPSLSGSSVAAVMWALASEWLGGGGACRFDSLSMCILSSHS